MYREAWRHGWLASRKDVSGAGGPRRLLAFSLTNAEASLGCDHGLLDCLLHWRGSRGATVVVALIAAFVFGFGGASFARAAGGTLTALSPPLVQAGEGTARVVVSPDGRSAYATNRHIAAVSQYSRDTETGNLTPLSPATVEAGQSPEGVVVSPDGKYLYVASHNSNAVSQYSRNTATGELTVLSPATVTAGNGPIGISISPDGTSVYAADSTSGQVSQYSRNAETGKLTALSPATVAAGANTHGIRVSPDGKNVYATNYGAGTVAQYSRNPETGTLTTLSPATVAAAINPHDLAISPDGKSIYVANNSSPGTVAQFTRNTATGKLTPLSPATVAAGDFSECDVVSPDGNDVYATNAVTNNISEYSRDTETGALTPLNPSTIETGPNPSGIATSPDGRSVYAVNYNAGTVSQYSRNLPPTVVTDSAGGVGQSAATVSGSVNPDGQATTYHFDYGTTTAYGAQAPAPPDPSAGSGSGAQPVSANLTGLAANTIYHFRIVATNASGTTNGSDRTVKTLPNPLTVVTRAASSITQTSATLNATVNPNGAEVSKCEVEYGTTNAYESSMPCSSLPGSGESPVEVSASVTGLTVNTTYHFRISATNLGGMSKGADQTFKTLPQPPTVETVGYLAKQPLSLRAAVNPNGGEISDCHFEYGLTTPYDLSVPCATLPGSGIGMVEVSAPVNGLIPNATYHFRIVATNPSGTSYGGDQTFTATADSPIVVTGSASPVTQTSAMLNATVNPNGGDVSECQFEYGATTGFGSSMPCTTPPGSGTTAAAVSASVGGLVAGTTYYFRIVASNVMGVSYGAVQSLTTQLPTALTQVGPGGQGVLSSQEHKTPPVPDAELASASLTGSSSGAVRVSVACPAGESSCTGTVTLRTLTAVSPRATGHRSKKQKAVILTLAVGSFKVAGGQAKVVTLHLSAKARTLLSRTSVLRVRATLVAHDPEGATHTAQTIVTLRASKARTVKDLKSSCAESCRRGRRTAPRTLNHPQV